MILQFIIVYHIIVDYSMVQPMMSWWFGLVIWIPDNTAIVSKNLLHSSSLVE